jgi:membrane-associated protease RseP (regulator of RpoE activity)
LFFRSIYADAYQRNIFDLVQVHGVELGSEAERTGFKMYDLVVAINNKPVEGLTDIRRLLKPEETNTIIVRRVSRSESRLYDHHILKLKNPKTWMLAFDGAGTSGQTVHRENKNRRSGQFAEKK